MFSWGSLMGINIQSPQGKFLLNKASGSVSCVLPRISCYNYMNHRKLTPKRIERLESNVRVAGHNIPLLSCSHLLISIRHDDKESLSDGTLEPKEAFRLQCVITLNANLRRTTWIQ